MTVSKVLKDLDRFGSAIIDNDEAGLIFIRKLPTCRYHVGYRSVRGNNLKNIYELSKVGLIRFLHSVKVK